MTTDIPADPLPPPVSQASQTAGLTTKVVKGSLWTLAGQAAPLAISLLATPFTIRLLGAEGYGVFVLIILIPTFLSFADLGMGLGSTKFASEAYADGDTSLEARIVRTAALISFLASLPVAVLLIGFADPIIALFNVSEAFRAEGILALRIAAVTFVISFLNGIFNTPQLTRLRMDLNTFVSAGFRIMGTIAVPFVIYFGGGIVGAATVLLLASLFTLAGNLLISNNLNGKLFEATVERNAFRPMLKFGFSLLVSNAALIMLGHSEKLMLPALVSVESLAYYSVAATLATMATMFSSAMMQSLIPAFSQLVGPEKKAQFDALFSRSIRISILWFLPTLLVMFVAARPFFTLWAGEDFGRNSTYPFYILLAGLVFNLVVYVPYAAIVAAGRTEMVARLFWAELAVYLLLLFGLISFLGIIGAAIAWSVRIGIDAAGLIFVAKRVVGTTFSLREHVSFVLIALLTFSPPIVLAVWTEGFSIWPFGLGVISLALYLFLAWNRFMKTDEKAWLRRTVTGSSAI